MNARPKNRPVIDTRKPDILKALRSEGFKRTERVLAREDAWEIRNIPSKPQLNAFRTGATVAFMKAVVNARPDRGFPLRHLFVVGLDETSFRRILKHNPFPIRKMPVVFSTERGDDVSVSKSISSSLARLIHRSCAKRTIQKNAKARS